MTMIINRFKDGVNYTIGSFLLLDENNNCVQSGFTLEPAGPDTTARGMDRRIPKGTYLTDTRFSPKFKTRTPRLFSHEVPKDRYILIHIGNFHYDTDGCILVGNSVRSDRVLESTKAFNTLMNNIDGRELKVEIR